MFISRYLRFVEGNEAPTPFHFWSALTVVAHVLGRRVSIDRGYFTSYPGQMITFLVGPAATRKSTAINLAVDLLRDIPDINIIANKLSTQSLIDSLDRGMVVDPITNLGHPADSTGFISAPELSVFLPKQSYVDELIPTLTDIFDAKSGPWINRTRGSGTVTLMNPLITMAAASTPDWLQTNIPINAYGGGFMSRIFFVWQGEKSKLISRPEKDPNLKRRRLELLTELTWIRNNLKGPVIWTKEGEDWYDNFYSTWNADKTERDEFHTKYHDRRAEHILRVATCLAAAEEHSLALDVKAFEKADEALRAIESQMFHCFENNGQIQAFSGNYNLVLKQLEKGPKTKRELQRSLWRNLSAVDLGTALQTFIDAGLIEASPQGQTFLYSLPRQL